MGLARRVLPWAALAVVGLLLVFAGVRVYRAAVYRIVFGAATMAPLALEPETLAARTPQAPHWIDLGYARFASTMPPSSSAVDPEGLLISVRFADCGAVWDPPEPALSAFEDFLLKWTRPGHPARAEALAVLEEFDQDIVAGVREILHTKPRGFLRAALTPWQELRRHMPRLSLKLVLTGPARFVHAIESERALGVLAIHDPNSTSVFRARMCLFSKDHCSSAVVYIGGASPDRVRSLALDIAATWEITNPAALESDEAFLTAADDAGLQRVPRPTRE